MKIEQTSCLQMRITQTATITAIKLTTLQLPIKISLDAVFYATRKVGKFQPEQSNGLSTYC